MSSEKTYLWKNKLGIYTFRRRVPEELRSILKKAVVQISLKTRDLAEATKRCEVELMDCDKLFDSAKRKLNRSLKKRINNVRDDELIPEVAEPIQPKRLPALPEMKMSISIPTQLGNIVINAEINAQNPGEDLSHYTQSLKSTLTTMMQSAATTATPNLIQFGHQTQLLPQQTSYESQISNITRSKNRATLKEFAEIFYLDRGNSGRWSTSKSKGHYESLINIFERLFAVMQIK